MNESSITMHAGPWTTTEQTKHFLKAKQHKYRHNLTFAFPRTNRPHPPPLEAKVKNYLVFEDGNEQHDGETGEQAKVLQDKVAQLTALVFLAVAMEHLW